MKRLIIYLLVLPIILISCKTVGSMSAIQPKSGTIDLPTKGEFRIWQKTVHPAFTVTLTNPSATQSCEIYKVTEEGNEKWINPSLLAGTTLTVRIPANGHLFIKNFNPNILTIKYTVN
ncbi:MAG: hypothetical protein H7289_03965 [Mucilaginibacter sp.]|nr:hypothetical protein [Mucilaginibacter sp.]